MGRAMGEHGGKMRALVVDKGTRHGRRECDLARPSSYLTCEVPL